MVRAMREAAFENGVMAPLENVGGLRDLDQRSKIHDLVVDFYREVVFDDLLAPVFGEVAEVDWAEHIPKLINYWCQVLLREPGYDGFILAPHRAVHESSAFDVGHFDRWYTLWVRCIDAGWSGPVAERAKRHAEAIAAVLARRLLHVEWEAPVHVRPSGPCPG